LRDRLVLASRSPQRRAILARLGIDFAVDPPDVEELTDGEPHRLVAENARRKARAVARRRTAGEAVLGVDTAVAVRERVLGKPRSEDEAREFLTLLGGRRHEVHSGIALIRDGGERSAEAVTRVLFRELEPSDVDRYLATGEWRDRAGGYAIQGRGATLVERIEGDYLNVVGLPVAELVRLAPDLFRSGPPGG
jgi:septum formation protein